MAMMMMLYLCAVFGVARVVMNCVVVVIYVVIMMVDCDPV